MRPDLIVVGEVRGAEAKANTAQWAATGEGTAAMFASVSKETTTYRSMGPAERTRKSDRFLEDEDE